MSVVFGFRGSNGTLQCDVNESFREHDHTVSDEHGGTVRTMRVGKKRTVDLCDAHSDNFRATRRDVRNHCHWNSKQNFTGTTYGTLQCTMEHSKDINDRIASIRRHCWGARRKVQTFYALADARGSMQSVVADDLHEAFMHEELVNVIGCAVLGRLRSVYTPMLDRLLTSNASDMEQNVSNAMSFAETFAAVRVPDMYPFHRPAVVTDGAQSIQTFTSFFDDLLAFLVLDAHFSVDTEDNPEEAQRKLCEHVASASGEFIRSPALLRTAGGSYGSRHRLHVAFKDVFISALANGRAPHTRPDDRALTFYGCICIPGSRFLKYALDEIAKKDATHPLRNALNAPDWIGVSLQQRIAYLLASKQLVDTSGTPYDAYALELLLAASRLV